MPSRPPLAESSAASFAAFFHRATGRPPYPYQTRLALGSPAAPALPELLSVPTREPQGVSPRSQAAENGRGHPLLALASPPWAPPELQRPTPRRLAYCLPMRTLVDQTATATQTWPSR